MTLSNDIKRVLELQKAVGYDSEDFSPCHEIRFYQASQDMASIIRQQQELLRAAYWVLDYSNKAQAAVADKIKTALDAALNHE